MEDQIILVYCLCDELLKGLHHKEDPQCRMSDAEVMTTGLGVYFIGIWYFTHGLLLLHSYRG